MQSFTEKEMRHYIIGAGGHATVINDMAINQNFKINGVFIDKGVKNITGLVDIDTIDKINQYDGKFLLAFGNIAVRKKIVTNPDNINVKWFSLIDKRAIISKDVTIGEGTVVMPGAVINAGAVIGNHVIINSGVIIEHGTIIGDHTHISPGSVLCGNTRIGEGTWIGAGSTVINEIEIGSNVIVGAGSVVIRNIENEKKVVGVPAREIKVYRK